MRAPSTAGGQTPSRTPRLSALFAFCALIPLTACEPQTDPQAPPQGYPPNPGQFSPQGYAPPPAQGYSPAQGYGYAPPQGYAPSQGYAPPQGYGPQAYPQAQADPINNVDLDHLRARAQVVLNELVSALPPAAQAKVAGVPFRAETKVGEVNAYAGCNEQHMPFMAITDGLLQTEAYMAQLRATDEVFGTRKLDAYLTAYARDTKPDQPIIRPDPSLIDPAQHVDPRKIARQHQLFEEQVAFVLGHELGHHYLGHTGCANGQSGDRAINVGDLFRFGNKVLPVTNQYNEVAADSAGIDDVIAAGARRQGYHWTEGGALLTLYFFSQLERLSLATMFLSSHPNPAYRVRPIQQEAARFRSTGQWFTPIVPMP
jgi:hypothetical protein